MTEKFERLLRLPEVERRVALKRSTIYRRIKEGSFPKPRKLAVNVSVWPESEIDRWVEQVLQGAAPENGEKP
ncbi:MAG: AlpA family transcriptional regulator [Candidatus Zixiibacteriota bacterium]